MDLNTYSKWRIANKRVLGTIVLAIVLVITVLILSLKMYMNSCELPPLLEVSY